MSWYVASLVGDVWCEELGSVIREWCSCSYLVVEKVLNEWNEEILGLVVLS